MELGIGNYYIDRYGIDEGARRMVADGYTYIDFQLLDTDSEIYAARDDDFFRSVVDIKRALAAGGVKVSQIHGPWRYPPRDATDEDRAERFEKMTKAMVVARHLGAKYMAIHPLMPYGAYSSESPDEVLSINKSFFSALANVARSLGITVCLENMPFPDFPLSGVEQITDFIRDIDHPNLKMCFDTGHANIFPIRMSEQLEYAKDYIRIIHVHDNLADEDTHMHPYDGNIDWMDFAEGLYNIGYSGIFNLETAPVRYRERHLSFTDEEVAEREQKLARIAALIAG